MIIAKDNAKALKTSVDHIQALIDTGTLPSEVALEMRQALIHAYKALNTQMRLDLEAKKAFWAQVRESAALQQSQFAAGV